MIKIKHGQYFKTPDGLKLHYLDEGQGDPVIMLHGNPTWSIYYRQLLERLSPQYRCIVPDHMGCGFSEKPDDADYNYTLEQRIIDLENLLEHLEITENITLVVHDWGGIIGLSFAARHPEKIARLVVLNTAGFHLPEGKSFPWQLYLGRHIKMGDYLIRKFNLFSFLASWTCTPKTKMNRALRHAYRSPYNTWENRIATARFVQDIPLMPQDPGYEIISFTQSQLEKFRSIPIMLCWGEKDFVFDVDFLKEFEKYWPHAEIHRFPLAGHYVLEDAADDILPLVEQFLAHHPLPVGSPL